MKKYLIESIGRTLNIPISGGKECICRAVYSLAGQMALASLWDHDEDTGVVSIQHFKERAMRTFRAYQSLYPEIEHLLPNDKTGLLQEIYTIYRRCGFLYHSAHHISPAAPTVASCQGITLYRGCSPDTGLFMSGLGFYSIQERPSDKSISQMHNLQDQSFECYLDDLLRNNEWEAIEWPDNTEFLRLDPPFSGGYWKQVPDKDGRISLARFGQPNKLYVFYYYHNGTYYQEQIPEWRVRDFSSEDAQNYAEYRRIATALLLKYRALPAIKFKDACEFVEIRIGYRLPPSEEDFFKLYSWPTQYALTSSQPQVFTRIMAKALFPVFRHELEPIGYSFVEE